MNNTNAGPTRCEATLWSRGPLRWTFVARHRIWSLVQCHTTGECCVARIQTDLWEHGIHHGPGIQSSCTQKDLEQWAALTAKLCLLSICFFQNWFNSQVLVQFRWLWACTSITISYYLHLAYFFVSVEVSLSATTIGMWFKSFFCPLRLSAHKLPGQCSSDQKTRLV